MASQPDNTQVRDYTHQILSYFSETLYNFIRNYGMTKKIVVQLETVIKDINYEVIGKYNTVLLNDLTIILMNIKVIIDEKNSNDNRTRASNVIAELVKIKQLYTNLKRQNQQLTQTFKALNSQLHKAQVAKLEGNLRELKGLSRTVQTSENLKHRLLNLQLSPPTHSINVHKSASATSTSAKNKSRYNRTKTVRGRNNRTSFAGPGPQTQSLFQSPFLDLPKTYDHKYNFKLKLAEARTIVDKLLRALRGVQNKVNSTKSLSAENKTKTKTPTHLQRELTNLEQSINKFNAHKTPSNYQRILTTSAKFNILLNDTVDRGLFLTRTAKFTGKK